MVSGLSVWPRWPITQARRARSSRPPPIRTLPSSRHRPHRPHAAAPAVDPQTAEIENLANLHAQGILTDEEYAAAKAKALGI